MEKRAVKAEKQRDDALDKITLQRREIYRLGIELEEEKGRNKKLTAQLNHNYENSSIPSSMTMKKKKISNSREKTGRKQGAQTGHKGHGRKKQTPTETVILPAPQEALDNPDFKKTGKTIVKQLVGIHMVLDVTEYRADVYYNSKTGERVHAPFPAEDYNGIIVQDHEKTFYKYGSDHQECLAHVERYLKDSAENENGKSWSTMMRALLKEMIHYRNGLPRGEECSKEKINEFEARYLEIINTAKKEYEDEPPGTNNQ